MDKETKIDEDLYSRQLLTFGKDAMKRMVTSNILIAGMSGLGIEVAKCIILGGANSVTLHDSINLVDPYDLSSSYYLKEADVGKTKLDKLIESMQSLNSNVIVSTSTEILTDDYLNKFNLIVFCDYNLYDLFGHSKYCHDNNIKFIMANSHGLYGYVFCDFGEKFTVNDSDGEKLKSGVLVGVTQVVYKGNVVDDVIMCNEIHGLAAGNMVRIRVNGKNMDKLYKVTLTIDSNHFVLDENPFTEVKLTKTEFEQVKETSEVHFSSLQESILDPKFVITNYVDFDRPATLHSFTKVMWMMYSARQHENNGELGYSRFKSFPKAWDNNDANTLIKLCKGLASDVNEDVVRKLSYTVSGKLCPNDSVIGSIAAQEAMKGCSGKYTPIDQWMYIDHLTAFPKIDLPYTGTLGENFTPNGSRYDGQIVVLGRELTERLNKGKIFVVGSGAIGCEHIKNYSMMGVGNIVTTDMDHIEKSNLNRQFLFRPEDIGHPKSVTAAKKGLLMNPSISIEAHEYKVGNETLNIYNKEFFDTLTCVANALDNIPARQFVDSLCVKYQKYLLESGTLGTKCNVQVVVPKGSESYGSSEDPDDGEIPVCTLKLFPYLFEHVVQYARDMMEGFFNNMPNNYLTALKDFKSIEAKSRTDIVHIYNDIKTLKDNRAKTYKQCVQTAYTLWHKNFRDQIHNITKKFPEDSMNKDGSYFWSGTKRYPTFTEFNTKNRNHMGFVVHMAHIWADMFKIDDRIDATDLKSHMKMIRKFEVPSLVVSDIKMKTDEKEGEEAPNKEEEENENTRDMDKSELLKQLKQMMKKEFDVQAIEFEKDDDSNHHIDFITCASNMRALNYGIETKDRLSVKQIAGKIIPAIATTTSLASGLVAIELYKVFQGKDTIEEYMDSFCNLAITQYSQSEPKPVHTSVINDVPYNIWTWLDVNGDMTLGELIEQFEDPELDHKKLGKMDLELKFVSHMGDTIYFAFMGASDDELKQTLRDLIKDQTENPEAIEELIIGVDPPEDDDSDSDSDKEEVDPDKELTPKEKLRERLLRELVVNPILVKVTM